MSQRAAFLDRDGTLNRPPAARYLASASEFAWQPGAIDGLVMLARADLSASWMLGDRLTDVAAGAAAGCRTVLVGGLERHAAASLESQSLRDAAEQILALG